MVCRSGGPVLSSEPIGARSDTARADRTNRTNIRFTNNRSTTPGPGYMVDFENVTTLTVTGNVQPLTSGQFAYLLNNTNLTYP